MKVAGAILAAGASRRLGRPKQLLPLRGEPLLRVLAREVLGSRCDPVGVVIPRGEPEIAGALTGLSLTLLENAERAEGMASSVRLAASWGRQIGCDGLVLAVCDQVFLTRAHVDDLIAAMTPDVPIVASRYAGTVGVPAVFRERTFPLLLALRGDVGARSVIRAVAGATFVEWPEGASDVDTLDDVVALAHRGRLAQGS